ncbi:putative helicase MOV-10 [Culex pipiens pallens]|uniref:putative helicase MOV-10 n=1 Tax=Culex pipiens pallens TaxID=42434 RepID=UPI0019530A52|nr:putative helicase MOV-10 [Culex pipiens pallens]
MDSGFLKSYRSYLEYGSSSSNLLRPRSTRGRPFGRPSDNRPFIKRTYKKPPKIEIAEYEVPEAVRRIYENKFKPSATFGTEENLLLAEVAEAKQGLPLTVSNYKPRLELLNQIEDEHVNKEFRRCFILAPTLVPKPNLVDRAVGGFKYQLSKHQIRKYSSIIKEDVGVRFSVEFSDDEIKKFSGTVDLVDAKYVIIFTEKELQYNRVTKIEFLAERTTYQMEYRALEMLQESVIERVFFAESYTGKSARNPYIYFSSFSFEWFRPSVASNHEQVQAIQNIVNQTSFPAPYVLFGPPGTGKTSTLVEAIGQIYKLLPTANVLAVATSNSAANELTSRLLEIIPEKDIFRFFAKSCARKKKDIEQDVLDVSNLRSWNIGMDGKRFYENIRPCRVVLCTASTAGRLVNSDVPKNHFSYIFIDECGSAKEVSSLVPIIGIGVHGSDITASIVLAGDPKQLGPVIPYAYLNDTTHSVSLLERIADKGLYARDRCRGKYDPRVITQLRDNFRSHPTLLEFPNRAFYQGELRAKASPEKTHWAAGWDRLPNRSFPLIFHSVVGETMQDENSSSMYNEQEAEQVLSYVERIIEHGICGRMVEQSSIGIISPYASQVRLLRNLLNKRHWSDIEVGSTEQYQGREKPIMLMSTVRARSKSAEFLNNAKRINVSLTRAQALLIVVGDPGTLERIDHWRSFIRYCRENGAVVESSVKLLEGPSTSRKYNKKKPQKPEQTRSGAEQESLDSIEEMNMMLRFLGIHRDCLDSDLD